MAIQISAQSQNNYADLSDQNGLAKKNTKILLSPKTIDLHSYPRTNQSQWEDRQLHKSKQLESLVRIYKEEDEY